MDRASARGREGPSGRLPPGRDEGLGPSDLAGVAALGAADACVRRPSQSSSRRHIQDPARQRLTWNKSPKSVLVIKKVRDASLLQPFKELCAYLMEVSAAQPRCRPSPSGSRAQPWAGKAGGSLQSGRWAARGIRSHSAGLVSLAAQRCRRPAGPLRLTRPLPPGEQHDRVRGEKGSRRPCHRGG